MVQVRAAQLLVQCGKAGRIERSLRHAKRILLILHYVPEIECGKAGRIERSLRLGQRDGTQIQALNPVWKSRQDREIIKTVACSMLMLFL